MNTHQKHTKILSYALLKKGRKSNIMVKYRSPSKLLLKTLFLKSDLPFTDKTFTQTNHQSV